MGAANLSGLWTGSFAYPAGEGPTTPFTARIEDRGGRLGGTIVEPNTVGRGSPTLEAVLHGRSSGGAVDFVKTYDGASDAAHPVDYVGRLSDDGNSIAGVWSLGALDGTFEMRREAASEEPAVRSAEAETVL